MEKAWCRRPRDEGERGHLSFIRPGCISSPPAPPYPHMGLRQPSPEYGLTEQGPVIGSCLCRARPPGVGGGVTFQPELNSPKFSRKVTSVRPCLRGRTLDDVPRSHWRPPLGPLSAIRHNPESPWTGPLHPDSPGRVPTNETVGLRPRIMCRAAVMSHVFEA
ncbi:hypothetical protein DPEC_G00304460 [Dallia pectoralis]|uniref:Uncharacterized protein n=1 Tax=Dallia pectoralis TaxID=75939 RepID=A0ACC2FDT6_DALPE|nr:hypothetical protein DPEC_G00304460 [Dallia pectoralis]